MDIQAISTAIAGQLGSLGLHVYDYATDEPNAPCVYIYPSAEGDPEKFAGANVPKFIVRFLIASTQTQGGQKALNTLISTGVTGSAIDKLTSPNTLGGAVSSVRVEMMRNYGVVTLADSRRYFSAELVLDVLP